MMTFEVYNRLYAHASPHKTASEKTALSLAFMQGAHDRIAGNKTNYM